MNTPDKARTAPTNPEVLRQNTENKALAERRSFAKQTDNLFGKLEDDFLNDSDPTSEKVGMFLAVERKKIKSGLERDDLSGTHIFAFLVLAATHGASAKESLADKAFDKDLRPETEARMKMADEFFMKGAAMVFGDEPISTSVIPNKLALMHKKSEDRLKLPDAICGLGSVALTLNYIQRDAHADLTGNPTALLDRIQNAKKDLNDSAMEYNQTVLLPRLAENPTASDRQRLMTDAQDLAKMLYELRLIENTLKDTLPKGVPSSKTERDTVDALREAIADNPKQVPEAKATKPQTTTFASEPKATETKEHPLDKWLGDLIQEDNVFAERPQSGTVNSFRERQFAPMLESLVKVSGSQEKARQTFERWMDTIDRSKQKYLAGVKDEYAAQNMAVRDFLASSPSLFIDAFEAGKRLQNDRAEVHKVANGGIVARVNFSPEYIVGNLYDKFKKRKV